MSMSIKILGILSLGSFVSYYNYLHSTKRDRVDGVKLDLSCSFIAILKLKEYVKDDSYEVTVMKAVESDNSDEKI